MLGKSDPLIGDALQTVLDRGDFIPLLPDEGPAGAPAGGAPAPIETDPAIVDELMAQSQASIAAAKRDIRTQSGAALLDFILSTPAPIKASSTERPRTVTGPSRRLSWVRITRTRPVGRDGPLVHVFQTRTMLPLNTCASSAEESVVVAKTYRGRQRAGPKRLLSVTLETR